MTFRKSRETTVYPVISERVCVPVHSDFKAINHLYGTLDDWDALQRACSDRGMKIM